MTTEIVFRVSQAVFGLAQARAARPAKSERRPGAPRLATHRGPTGSGILGIGLWGLAAGLALGCGGGGGRANLDPGPMPQGGDFTGVYFSPQYGTMQIVQTGSAVIGEYEKDERLGRIQGTVQGDVLRFQWEEQRQMVAGRTQSTRGRGYFRYSVGSDGDHYIIGEWGIDDDEIGGGPWRGVKARNRRPQLSGETQGGDEGSGDADDGWGDGSDDSPQEPAGEPSEEELPEDDALDDLGGLDL